MLIAKPLFRIVSLSFKVSNNGFYGQTERETGEIGTHVQKSGVVQQTVQQGGSCSLPRNFFCIVPLPFKVFNNSCYGQYERETGEIGTHRCGVVGQNVQQVGPSLNKKVFLLKGGLGSFK